MRLHVKLAVRDWDYLTPLALRDVKSKRLDIEVHRVSAVQDWALNNDFDAGEVSFSKYVQGCAFGGYPMRCIPHFMMRGFRQRCILTGIDGNFTKLEDLENARIGVTGWADSGNTWTRALLRRVGLGIEDVRWYAGRLNEADPAKDRLGRYVRPGRIEAMPEESTLVSKLETGEIDALFTPFLPSEFLQEDTKIRFLMPDFREKELQYFRDVGYVPGIHVLGIKPDICKEYPWLAGELSEMIDESARVWMDKRTKYQDTTPWLIDEIVRTGRDLPSRWNMNGYESNERMINDFLIEMSEQGLIERPLDARTLFSI